MLLTHTNECGQISFSQLWGVTLRHIPAQGRNLHTSSTKGIVGRLSQLIKKWEWAICFQASCVSSASVDKLVVVVQLVCCFIRYFTRSATASPLYQVCLTLGLMRQAGFSIIQHQKHQDNPLLHSPLIALQTGRYLSCFTPLQAEHPAAPPHPTPACYRWIAQQFLTRISCTFQIHWCFQLCIDTCHV